jgi:peptidoglycan/LPS O-acetylase OafA/YrhL
MSRTQFIPCLTPLRGIAALLIIIFHYQLLIAKIFPADYTNFFNKLYLMVDLFFVLSGFIMYHVFGEHFKNGLSLGNFYRFMKSRFARIYPLHLVTLLYVIGLSILVTQTNTPIGFWSSIFDSSAIFSQLMLTQAMGTHDFATWNSASWSISVEWWAYICFPVFIILLTKTANWSRFLLVITIFAAYANITYSLQPDYWSQGLLQILSPNTHPDLHIGIDVINGYQAFMRCLCGFGLGLVVYEAYQKGWGNKILSNGLVFSGCWIVLIISWHFNLLHDPLAVSIFCIMILSASYNRGKVAKLLNGSVFQYVGNISYSLYLVHLPLIYTFIVYRKMYYQPDPQALNLGYSLSLIDAWTGLLLFLVVTFIFSSMTYKYIENPARKFLNKR